MEEVSSRRGLDSDIKSHIKEFVRILVRYGCGHNFINEEIVYILPLNY